MKKMYGSISINRDSQNVIRMRIKDSISGDIVTEVLITPSAFGYAVTGLGEMPIIFESYEDSHVGLARELKTELVPYKALDTGSRFKETYAKAVAPYEVDGWKADVERAFNHHRVRGDLYEVNFVRYVEPSEEDVQRCKKEFDERTQWY